MPKRINPRRRPATQADVEALSESVRDGYVSAPDLIRVLREEYEIDIIGG